jgi:TonB family protein
LFIFMLSSVVFPLAQDDFVIKSRLFKSMGKATKQKSDVVISIFSVPVLIPFHPSYIQLEKISIYRLKRELQKIYKIEDIDHLASGIMLWDGKKSQVQGMVLVKEASYPMLISPSLLAEGNFNLRVQVAPPREALSNRNPEESLLDTEMVMREGTPYVLGFPSDGNRYFLSISIAKKEAGQFQEGEYSQASPEQDIPETPTPIHRAIPAYPITCQRDNIGGKVILHVSIDKQGNVTNVKILNSPHTDLSRAAIDAIQQWKFEPIMKRKKPISATFPIIVDFKSKGDPSEEEKVKRSFWIK